MLKLLTSTAATSSAVPHYHNHSGLGLGEKRQPHRLLLAQQHLANGADQRLQPGAGHGAGAKNTILTADIGRVLNPRFRDAPWPDAIRFEALA
jgi:hypothetical protein